ncbi:hypothetical protein [Flavivirga spongiicola]|uniref:Uncharacterized protein n=1 Tax=Flavivirga spongiicola TaxID=421621 RepID=A0ABU7XTT1_9FLAO|nr:hypothetical protein [Flavivirga sp. MEBiC05379]MDO5978257.1 hypothetical protein [Flavivirga sp. MEBiC05379]
MSKPSKTKVYNYVKERIGDYANFPASKIKESYELTKHPLKMDTPKINFMSLSLRGYVKKHDSSKTVLAKEVKKAKTVLNLCKLINKKING